ncbi:MAG: YHS domain-containing protein [Candidatus Marinimicrobia bacterium]|nr:YHS domain-containing protein [Candidatus Neomarinimicrobiota bacterium]
MEETLVDKEEVEREGRVREYNGKKYYLCCDECITDFDANPEQYAQQQ